MGDGRHRRLDITVVGVLVRATSGMSSWGDWDCFRCIMLMTGREHLCKAFSDCIVYSEALNTASKSIFQDLSQPRDGGESCLYIFYKASNTPLMLALQLEHECNTVTIALFNGHSRSLF